MKSVLLTNPVSYGDVSLTSKKPFVVLRSVVVAEGHDDGSGVKPLEEECDGVGIRVQDVEVSQHEFDSLKEAMSFAALQHDSDKNPVGTTVLEFQDGEWKIIQRKG